MPSYRGLRRVLMAGFVGWFFSGGVAIGQPGAPSRGIRATPESVRSLRLAEHNQLGILEYCLAQGSIGEEIVALQRAALERLPSEPQDSAVDGAEEREAEAGGKRGMVGFGSAQVPIGEAALAEGIPVASRCKQMGMSVQAEAGRTPTW